MFSNSTVFKSFHSGECFHIIDLFSLTTFKAVVWTVAVSGTKQYHFCLKTVYGQGIILESWFTKLES